MGSSSNTHNKGFLFYVVTLNNHTVSQEKKGGLSGLFKRSASIDNLNDNEVSMSLLPSVHRYLLSSLLCCLLFTMKHKLRCFSTSHTLFYKYTNLVCKCETLATQHLRIQALVVIVHCVYMSSRRKVFSVAFLRSQQKPWKGLQLTRYAVLSLTSQ